MKWKRTVLLSFLMLISFVAGAFGANELVEKVDAFIRHDYQLYFNGVKANVGDILIYNGKSYLPLANTGKLFGAEVTFDGETKSIHIRKEQSNTPTPSPGNTQGDPQDYDTTALVYTSAFTFQLNGREYPVLAFTDVNYKLYYRDRDLQRANIDTSKARKTKEAVTKEFYVSEAELKRILSPLPKFAPYYNRLVIGENDPERLQALIDYIEYLPEFYKLLHQDPWYYYPTPYILLIERLQDNDYVVLTTEDQNYMRYSITMMLNSSKEWQTQSVKPEKLGSPNDYSGYYSF